MHIYVNNFLVAGDQPENLKGLIYEIGKKAGIRTVIRDRFVSFAPPVNRFLVDLSFTAGLKSIGDSLKERLTVSGFTTDPITSEQRSIYGRKLRELRLSLREENRAFTYGVALGRKSRQRSSSSFWVWRVWSSIFSR